MRLVNFTQQFDKAFPRWLRNRPALWYAHGRVRRWFDPCPDVQGMSSIRKLRLLELAVKFLETGEGYLEVGTFHGKSLIATLRRAHVPAAACDNFSEFVPNNSAQILRDNLRRYGLTDRVTFHDADFRRVLDRAHVPFPVGMYLYDGAHDETSQYDGVVLAEPILADRALVIIDDWCWKDAKVGTERAIAESKNSWRLLYDLPARYNGDHGLWWNGVAVFSFERRTAR